MDNEAPRSTDYGLTELAAKVVSAYVSKNAMSPGDLPMMITSVHAALQGLGAPVAEPVEELKPAVPIKRSVTPDYIICLDDGRKFKSMRRHLALIGMTPDSYRAKWKLPADYPMVAPSYSSARSDLAKASGLGRNAEPKPAHRGRRAATA